MIYLYEMDQSNIQTPTEVEEKYSKIVDHLDETIASIQREWEQKFDNSQRQPGFALNKLCGNDQEQQ